MLQVDSHGLDHIDHKLLTGMIERFRGGPVGIDTISASIGEESVTIEDVYEPYLFKLALSNGRRVGRVATRLRMIILDIAFPEQLIFNNKGEL